MVMLALGRKFSACHSTVPSLSAISTKSSSQFFVFLILPTPSVTTNGDWANTESSTKKCFAVWGALMRSVKSSICLLAHRMAGSSQ